MKAAIGLLMCVSGLALGLYVGVWWAFVGGIVDVITEIRSEYLDSMNVAIGIAKVIFAGAIGGFSALVLIVPGAAMLQD